MSASIDAAEIDRFLALYAQLCAEAGVEPLPDDEARAQATALTKVLLPGFEVTFRQH